MLKFDSIKKNIIQLYSLTIKDLKLHTRYKSEAIIESLAPLLSIFFPYIIFNTLFSLNSDVFGGYYSESNFLLFIRTLSILPFKVFPIAKLNKIEDSSSGK